MELCVVGGMDVPELLLILTVCYIVAWVFGMNIIVERASQKGYEDLKWKLWFIGLFSTPITACLIAILLPDKNV